MREIFSSVIDGGDYSGPIDLWVANAARFADDGRVCEHWGMANDTVAELVRQMGVDANNLAPAS